jgi:hypothetical protein
VIFQHWFLPARKDGGYKKAHETWKLTGAYIWQPRTYFGRVQVVSVFDCIAKVPDERRSPLDPMVGQSETKGDKQ